MIALGVPSLYTVNSIDPGQKMALYAGRTGMGAARRMTPMAARGFATEKQIALRIAATSNLKKITSSMKMVSQAKMKGDGMRLDQAKEKSSKCSLF